MDNYRLKLRIGEHEFEAEGPSDIVTKQFEAFQAMIQALASAPAKQPEKPADGGKGGEVPAPGLASEEDLGKIFQVSGRYVSLTARPERVSDAALLLLFGQKRLRGQDLVTGAELLEGLKQSGYQEDRADRVMDKIDPTLYNKTGLRRGVKYRLTNPGVTQAQGLVSELAASF
jgi:hypothetical protein